MRHGIKALSVTVLALVTTSAALSGCSSSNNRRFGFLPPDARLVGQETINRIKPGETTADWLEAVLGPATNIESLHDPMQEVWKYRYQMVGGSYRIHARNTSGGTVRTLYVQMASGTVTDKWMD